MKITCLQCLAVYSIDDALLQSGPVKAQCPACQAVVVVQPPGASSAGPKVERASAASLPPMPGGERPSPPAAAASQNAPERPAAPEERCSRCGGLIREKLAEGGLCQRCRQLRDVQKINEEREWRVKREDGVILGPLSLAEVKKKFQLGEIAAGDLLARGEREFRLGSSYPEFLVFFRRPGENLQLKMVSRESRTGRLLTGIILLLVLGGAGLAWWLWPRAGVELPKSDPLQQMLAESPGDPSAPVADPVEVLGSARRLFWRGSRLGYLEADRLLKQVLRADPANREAVAAWVQNRAMLDFTREEVTGRKQALDIVDDALRRDPDNIQLLRARAFLLFSLNNLVEARELSMRIEARQPEDAETLLLRGMVMLEANTELALESLQRSLKLNPQLLLAYHFLGEAHIRQGKFRSALADFEQRLKADPSQIETLVAQARLYLRVGQFKEAQQAFEFILSADEQNIEAAVALAAIEIQLRRSPSRALDLLAGFLEKNKDPAARAQLLAQRAIALRLQGKPVEAQQAIAAAVQADPMCLEALYQRVVLAQEAGQIAQAVGWSTELKASLSNHARLAARMAELDYQVPRYDEASRGLRRANELDPSDLEVVLAHASLFLSLDDINQAYTWLRRVTGISPFIEEDFRHLRPYFDGPGFLAPSWKRIEGALSRYSDDPLAHALAGIVQFRMGRAEAARAELQKALELDPECVLANLYLGVMSLEAGKLEAAVRYLEEAHQADANSSAATLALGVARLRQNRADKAVALFEDILLANPADVHARAWLAEAWLARGKKDRALAEALKAYPIDRNHTHVCWLLFRMGH
ncbi:MAG: tetratricopeptide repeat protein [Myxococcales bacterium]|nr:tetratricopeptide repeat protein [Myxococcales bacterium]